MHLGAIVAGRYQLMEYLGSAAFSKVGRCRLTPGCRRVDRAWFQR